MVDPAGAVAVEDAVEEVTVALDLLVIVEDLLVVLLPAKHW